MSDELKELKLKIVENNDVESILEALGCEINKYEQVHKEYPLLTAKPPNSRNKRAVQVRLSPSLPAYIRNEGVKGDIFTLIGFFLYKCRNFDETKHYLYQIKQWICNILGYELEDYNNISIRKGLVVNKWIRDIKRKRERSIFDYDENFIIDERQLDYFERYPHIQWVNEGISPKTQRFFGVSYDIDSERIVVPIHNKDGNLIGTKGRYAGCNESLDEKYKYIYIHPCNKSIELFNYHRALPYIKKYKRVIIVEGFKTVMKLWQWGYRYSVSIEGDDISPIQVKLLKDLGVDVTLIFAWDKDKVFSKNKEKDFIGRQLRQIRTRNVQFIYDRDNILEDPKASPADEGLEKWKILYRKNRYKFVTT